MDTRSLLTFLHVAERSSFTAAAHALNYSQSTVSFQIKQLETEVGCPLFERINHTVSLTERGREFLTYAQSVLRMTDEFMSSDGEDVLRGTFRIATSDSICEEMIQRDYLRLHSHHPHISLVFTNTDTDTMTAMLDHNEADLMIALDNHIYRSDYVTVKEEPIPMCFVTGASSPYATTEPLSLRELAEKPLILTEGGVGYRRALEEVFAKESLALSPILEIGRTDIIADILVRGVGISFLPAFVVRKHCEEGKLVCLNVPDVTVDIRKQLLHHKNKWISPALEALIRFIVENEFC